MERSGTLEQYVGGASPMATTEHGPASYMPSQTAPGGAAGWWSRVGASILDGLIVLVPIFLGGLASAAGSDLLAGVLVVLYFVALVFYAPVMLAVRDGRTWGKQAADIRVVRMDGTAPGFGAAFGRELLKLIFGVTGILWFIDALWPLWQSESRALHDLAAGTRVVTDRGTGV
jgi:uncharacterized RDD family membrane protein YckC